MEQNKATAASGVELPLTLGALNPVGSVVMALPGGDLTADKARQALLEAGVPSEDIQLIGSQAMQIWIEEQFKDTSRMAGFGSEVSFMRRYRDLAAEGCGWLIVKAEGDEAKEQVVRVAQQFEARIAIKYNRLAHEELPVIPGMVPSDTPGL
jgi:hypothetical protein